jgi:hypothetical protein
MAANWHSMDFATPNLLLLSEWVDFLKHVAPLDPVVVLPKLNSTPLRVQQSLWEPGEVPAASRERIAAALPAGARLVQYRDIHDYSEKVGMNGKMFDWMYTSLSCRSMIMTIPLQTPTVNTPLMTGRELR